MLLAQESNWTIKGGGIIITEDTIKQRITELELQRDQLVIEANKQLTGLSITIMELQKLLESDKEGGEDGSE